MKDICLNPKNPVGQAKGCLYDMTKFPPPIYPCITSDESFPFCLHQLYVAELPGPLLTTLGKTIFQFCTGQLLSGSRFPSTFSRSNIKWEPLEVWI